MNEIKCINSEIKHQGRLLTFYEKTMSFPNGNTSKWDFIHHRGASAIVPVHDGKIVMVTQYRPGCDREMLEIPAGCLEKGEDPMVTAVRELEEETGFICDEAHPLINIFPSAAYNDEYVHVYYAEVTGKTHTNLDENEYVNVVEYSLDELLEKLKNREIEDCKTIAGILSYAAFYRK